MEQSFSHLKIINTRLHICLSESSVEQLMRISIKEPEIGALEFEEIMAIYKEHNNKIQI